MNEKPKTLSEKLEYLPAGACNAAILDEHSYVKRPYLFYFDDGIDAWIPTPETVDCILDPDIFGPHLQEIEIRFKKIEMTDAEYEAMPEG